MLVMAQCPNCGGNLQVDPSNDAAVCEFCGTPFIVEKAINNFNISVTNNVTNNIKAKKVVVGFDAEAQCAKAREALLKYYGDDEEEADDDADKERALNIYHKVLKEDPGNLEAELVLRLEEEGYSSGDYYEDRAKVFKAFQKGKLPKESKELFQTLVYIGNTIPDQNYGYINSFKSYFPLEPKYLYALYSKKDVLQQFRKSIANQKEMLYNSKQKVEYSIVKQHYDYLNEIQDVLAELDPTYEKESFPSPKAKSGCYVATCIYQSYDCPEVWVLRRYRDNKLHTVWYGRLFIRLYYAISPTIVRWFGKTKWFQKFFGIKLNRIVSKLKAKGYSDTPYHDLY